MGGGPLVTSEKQGPGRAAVWKELIQRCAAQDQSALSSLYDETNSYVHGVVWSIVRDSGDAEEVTLDVYTQVWRSAGAYASERGSAATWLIALARNKAIDRIRSKGGRMRHEEPLLETARFEVRDSSPEESAFASERRRKIGAALLKLNADQRRVVELAFFSGLTHTELAEKLGQPLGTVKSRLRTAMTILREALEGRVN